MRNVKLACDGIYDVLSNKGLARHVSMRIKHQLALQSTSVQCWIAADTIEICCWLECKDSMYLVIILS